jgi:hypothetical protein
VYVTIIFLGRLLHQLKIEPVVFDGNETGPPVQTTLDYVLGISREGKQGVRAQLILI